MSRFSRILLASALAMIGVPLVATFPTGAWAQSQPTSCSNGQQMCLEQTGRGSRSSPEGCRSSYSSCMKTGIWVGPQSGRRWPVEKK
jgi:hypothetical protein